MPRNEGPFHVVQHSYNDVHETYAIYLNNRKYLVPPRGKPLKRDVTYDLCDILNGQNPAQWPEKPKTKAELMRVGRVSSGRTTFVVVD